LEEFSQCISSNFFKQVPKLKRSKNKLIFLIGIIPRSGTNFLFNSLTVHPTCNPAAVPGEDHLFRNSDLLVEYIEKTSECWRSKWEGMDKKVYKDKLNNVLGNALVNLLVPESTKGITFLTKTPLTEGLKKIFKLIPESKIIVLLRDGKDAVESGVQSKFWSYEEGMELWNKNALEILDFQKSYQEKVEYFHLIKYEDLVLNPKSCLEKLLNFCSLDSSLYDWKQIKAQPVFGSSQNKNSKGLVDWQPKPADDNFNPLSRSKHWSKELLNQYYSICSESAIQLGYASREEVEKQLLPKPSFFNWKKLIKRALFSNKALNRG